MVESASSIPSNVELTALEEESSPHLTELFSSNGLDVDGNTLEKVIATADPKTLAQFMDKDGNFVINTRLKQSFTDSRKTILLSICIGGQGLIQPVDQGGGWNPCITFTHRVDPKDFVRFTVLLEAYVLRWSLQDASLVRSGNRSWPKMQIETNTHRTMSITASQLAKGDIASFEWCGTTDGENTNLNGETITGALVFQEEYVDGEADGGRELFEVIAESPYPDDDLYAIAFPGRDFSVRT